MKRRDFMMTTAAAALARPALAQSSSARELRFVPQGNLNNPDPVWTTTTLARNHGLMVWDTLYAVNRKLEPQPQMVQGHEILDDGRTWRFTLRDGLAFHDGEPVRAPDCIASVTRWAKRRGLGQRMLAQTDDIRAVSDRVFEIRMRKPYALMPTALADWCFVMPERVAKTSPFEQINEYTGWGPFRYLRDEWVSGSQAVYAQTLPADRSTRQRPISCRRRTRCSGARGRFEGYYTLNTHSDCFLDGKCVCLCAWTAGRSSRRSRPPGGALQGHILSATCRSARSGASRSRPG